MCWRISPDVAPALKAGDARDGRLKYEPRENIISKLLNLRTPVDGIRALSLSGAARTL